ncbi:MAG: hypothetical protein LBE89_03115 [Helicobacteraceae bacterium]|nr:hypothetical protein [Helicobacteraceae bacterium]
MIAEFAARFIVEAAIFIVAALLIYLRVRLIKAEAMRQEESGRGKDGSEGKTEAK